MDCGPDRVIVGSPSCRNVVGGRDWRRPELQQRYRGYFSSHLQRRIDACPG